MAAELVEELGLDLVLHLRGPGRPHRADVGAGGDLGRPPHHRELVIVLDQPHRVERHAQIADLGGRSDAGAGERTDVVQPAHDARVPGRVHARRVVQRRLVRKELRQLRVELGDRIRLVEAERLARRLRAVAEALPQLALRMLLAAEEDRLRARARDQHQHRLGLGKSGEVIEIAVEAVEVIAVAVAHPLGRRRHDREPGADPLEHRGAPGEVVGNGCHGWRLSAARACRSSGRAGPIDARRDLVREPGRAISHGRAPRRGGRAAPASRRRPSGRCSARRSRVRAPRRRGEPARAPRGFPARSRRTAPAGRRRCR